MATIIGKSFLVRKAIEANPFNSLRFSWIDLGILHIIKQDETIRFEDSLKRIDSFKSNGSRVRLPGCFNPLVKYGQYIHEFKDFPCWAFCGGLFSGDKDSLNKFDEKVMECLTTQLKDKNFITWEINIWTYIYCQNPDLFDFYYADHNLSMIEDFAF